MHPPHLLSCLNPVHSVVLSNLFESVLLFLMINVKQSPTLFPLLLSSSQHDGFEYSNQPRSSQYCLLSSCQAEKKPHVQKLGWQVMLKLI